MNKKTVSRRTLARYRQRWRREAQALERQIELLRISNHTLDGKVRDLGRLFQTAENYYRAQAIIADLLNRPDASIGHDLKQEVIAALYYGIGRIGQSRERGPSSLNLERAIALGHDPVDDHA